MFEDVKSVSQMYLACICNLKARNYDESSARSNLSRQDALEQLSLKFFLATIYSLSIQGQKLETNQT